MNNRRTVNKRISTDWKEKIEGEWLFKEGETLLEA